MVKKAKKGKKTKKPKKAKRSKKAKKPKKAAKPSKAKQKIGEVVHFYSNISVAVIKLNSSLKIGENISIEGATTNFKQKVGSMQVDHKAIEEAKKGAEVGMKVSDKTRQGDAVYKA